MVQFLTALFLRPAGRRPTPRSRLTLETLETREVPAVLPWTSVGPQPEPPTKVAHAKILFPVFRPTGHTNPEFRPAGHTNPELRPVSPVMILLPSLEPNDRLGILLPALELAGNTNPKILPVGHISPELNR